MDCRFESYQACEIRKMIEKITKFFAEVVSELKKVSWSTRQELLDATWIVLISSAALGLFISCIDFTLARFLTLMIR